MRGTSFELRESEWYPCELGLAEEIHDSVTGLRDILRPRLDQVRFSQGRVRVENLVGSVRMASGSTLVVQPKIAVRKNWAESVVQLLEMGTRIAITGSRKSQLTAKRAPLTEAIAHEYARRLERALASEGPIQVFERHQHHSRRLDGQLEVGKWIRRSVVDPATFPITRDDFTVANDFNQGLSVVAGLFRRSTSEAGLRARLRRLETAVLPGFPLPAYVEPHIARRRMPPQWNAFRSSWDIANAVLRNRSILGDPGNSVGL